LATDLEVTSLDHVIRDKLEEVDDPDPQHIAEAVVNALPDAELRDALVTSLSARIRIMIWNARRSIRPNASAKWADASSAFRIFRMRVTIGQNQWKFLGECSMDDVKALAAIRLAHAEASKKAGEQFVALADLMKENKAKVVGDLPAEKVAETLNGVEE
jgi:hypothetical protein